MCRPIVDHKYGHVLECAHMVLNRCLVLGETRSPKGICSGQSRHRPGRTVSRQGGDLRVQVGSVGHEECVGHDHQEGPGLLHVPGLSPEQFVEELGLGPEDLV